MRIFLTILFLFSIAYGQTNYYVDTSGNDANNGLTTATAWKTIAKVNSSTFSAGDSILFKRGESWNEKMIFPSSGSAGSPIIIGAYGTGNKPVFTGLQTVSLTNVGNIWSGIATNSVKSLNTVLVNGKIQAKGRYPNSTATNGGYLTFNTPTQNSIKSSSLTGTPSYVGKECVVRSAAWILDVVKVASQYTDSLNFSTPLTYNPISLGCNGFFFQNDSSFLDVQGEWSYDSASKKLCVYSTTSPTVQVSTIDTIVWVAQKHDITFYGISFQGANKTTFQLDTSNHITVKNCSINFSGTNAITGLKSVGTIIQNDSIQNSLNSAAYLRQFAPYTPTVNACDSTTVEGNYIKNTAVLAGMGLNAQGRYTALFVIGAATTITNNRVDSSGYIPIQFNGVNSLIKNNYVSNFCFVKDDGGGIYTVIGAYIPAGYNNGSIIRKNIVTNGIGAAAGKTYPIEAVGIYADNYVKNITVDSNSIYNCVNAGLYIHESDSNNIRGNNVLNSIGHALLLKGTNTYFSTGGNQIKNNALYSGSTSWRTIYRQDGTNLGTIDNNFYSRPSDESTSLQRGGGSYNLAAWQTLTGKDLNSKITPVGIQSNPASFVYNPTNHDSTITFTGQKVALRGIYYTGSITLQPYTSVIVFDAAIIKNYNYKFR